MSTEDTGSSRELLGGGLLVAVALGVGQVMAYAQTLVAARALTPAQFGAFSALLALTLIGNTVALALQAVTARHIVGTPGAERRDETAAAWRATLVVAVIVTAFWLAISPLVGVVLRLDSPATYLFLALGFLPLTLFGGALGIAQGHERHATLAGVYLSSTVPKYVLTIGLLLSVATLSSAMFGLAAGAGIGALLAWLLVRSQWRGGHSRHTTMLKEMPGATYALLALFALTNFDIVLGRAFLTPDEAGQYGVGIIITKMVTWLPQFVAVMAYARMVDARRGRTTLIGLGVVSAIGLLCTAAVALAPEVIVSVIAGPEYSDMAGLLPVFALIGAFGAVLQFVVFGLVAIRDKTYIPVVWAGCVALIGGVWVWHDSVAQVAFIMLVVVGTVAGIGVWRLILKRDEPAVEELSVSG
jgi:O-antigen/teichoic acid export membrane protein